MATFHLDLDLDKSPRIGARVRVRQGDVESCVVEASVFDAGAQADLSGKSARFCCLKPDRTMVRDASCKVSGSAITYTLDQQVSAASGVIELAYFEVLDASGAVIDSTQAFTIEVEEGAEAGSSGVSEDYFSELDDLIARYEQAIKQSQSDYEAAEAQRQTDYEQAEAARDAAQDANDAKQAENDEAQDANDAAQAKNNADQAANNAAAQGLVAVILASGEYDPETLEPTVEGAVGKMYLVPMPQAQAVAAAIPVKFSLTSQEDGSFVATQSEAADGDTYVEWLWINSAWERIGLSTATIDPITTDQVDAVAADSAPQGKQVLNLTGLSYLWAKVKAWATGAFAALSHTHPASQVTGLTASRALVSDSSGHPAASAVTATELGYLDGVTSGVQGQLDALGDSLSQTSGSPAQTTLIARNEIFTYWRSGALVLFYGTFIPASGVGSRSVLFSGLPAPKAEIRFTGMDTTAHSALRFCVNKSGQLCFSWEDSAAQTAGRTVQVSGAYVLF